MALEHDLMKVAEVAAALGYTDETVHRWCREGRLEYVQIGRGKRFRRAYIEDLVKRGTVPARADSRPAAAGGRGGGTPAARSRGVAGGRGLTGKRERGERSSVGTGR